MIKRTYSRRTALDAPTSTHRVLPSKRRRVDDACEAAASSPSSTAPAIFSDERQEDWTPPSSPEIDTADAIARKHGLVKRTTAASALLSSSPPRRALHAGSSSNK